MSADSKTIGEGHCAHSGKVVARLGQGPHGGMVAPIRGGESTGRKDPSRGEGAADWLCSRC